MRRLRSPLAIAALFLAAGVLLAWLAERVAPAAREPEPQFPRSLRRPELERLDARRTLVMPAPAPEAEGAPPAEAPPRLDPFLAALPRAEDTGVLVLEANALRHSRIGELFVECVLRPGGGRDPLDEIRRELGIDPLKDVDRIAFTRGGVIVSGFFERARLDRVEAESRVAPRGAEGRVYYERRESDADAAALGTWRNGLLVLGEPAFVEQALDRVERASPESRQAIPEYLTYGEGYGVVSGAALLALFHGDQADLGRRLAQVASRIEIHADAMRDVAVVAHVSGKDATGVDDLGSTIGAALAIGRLRAAAGGDEKLAQLLEHARVVRGPAGFFSLELALPVQVVEGWFSGCEAAAPRATEPPAPPP